jgi:hypothetical protein
VGKSVETLLFIKKGRKNYRIEMKSGNKKIISQTALKMALIDYLIINKDTAAVLTYDNLLS